MDSFSSIHFSTDSSSRKTTTTTTTSSSTVHINRKFINSHINPNFLIDNRNIQFTKQPQNNIYINPKFINQQQHQELLLANNINNDYNRVTESEQSNESAKSTNDYRITTIIPKANTNTTVNRKLIRNPSKPIIKSNLMEKSSSTTPSIFTPRLIKIGQRKLVRCRRPSLTTTLMDNSKINALQSFGAGPRPPVASGKLLKSNYKIINKKENINVNKGVNHWKTSSAASIDALKLSNRKIFSTATPRTPLIKIGNRKLIRAATLIKTPTQQQCSSTMLNGRNKQLILSKYKLIKNPNQYRIDLRSSPAATNQQIGNQLNISNKIIITDRKLSRIGGGSSQISFNNSSSSRSTNININNKQKSIMPNNRLELLNINGVLYKSTKNKLQKTKNTINPIEKTVVSGSTSNSRDIRSLYIRGEQFTVDSSGRKLIRSTNRSTSKKVVTAMKRIDIGGLTFIEKSDNTFERTDIHRTRNYLTTAKQKSINFLSMKYVKCNIPCEIYRKIGKCRAHTNGRCVKVHDPKTISICSKYLKGACDNDKCLLSHDVNLSKMPTCKFYLKGICVKLNCPYLHKKVNDNTDICQDFLKGFCAKADQCNKKHQFQENSDYSKNKSFKNKSSNDMINENQMITSNNKKHDLIIENNKLSKVNEIENQRYFFKDANPTMKLVKEITDINAEKKTNDVIIDSVEYIHNSKRPKLGKLPSYIPIE